MEKLAFKFQEKRKESDSTFKMKLLYVLTFFLCLSVGKCVSPHLCLGTDFAVASVIDVESV